METQTTNETSAARENLLYAIGRNYVTEGLGKKNFDAIPYAEDVVLRAPLCPGGPAKPLTGKNNLREIWWAPLPDLLGRMEVLDTFVNINRSAVAVEFHLEVMVDPPVKLRILDRFKVNSEGKITDQENFFDPRH
jgi:hypothetical protein